MDFIWQGELKMKKTKCETKNSRGRAKREPQIKFAGKGGIVVGWLDSLDGE
jgi:hypothetical protein